MLLPANQLRFNEKQIMNWKGLVGDYLNFTKKDRIAVLVLCCIIIFVLLAPNLVSSLDKNENDPILDSSWITELRTLRSQQEFAGPKNAIPNPESLTSFIPKDEYTKGELFYFDPNKLDRDQWQKLGLRNKTITTILNYLSKGGHFFKPEDLSKIYGLSDAEFEGLAPFIRIEGLPDHSFSSPARPAYVPTTNNVKKISNIEVNTADSLAWISLPGIGNRLATRIINFRNKLGGFYSIDQVSETYGLPDSVFQKIRPYLELTPPTLKRISINTASLEELKAHPYIRYSLANPIIAYRNEHGLFERPEDLKKIAAITDELFQKIIPYLTIDD